MMTHIKTGLRGLDHALGGGIPVATDGCLVLVSGAPGVGKTSLLVAIGNAIEKQGKRSGRVVMVSVEQTLRDLAMMFSIAGNARAVLGGEKFALIHETSSEAVLRFVSLNAPAPIMLIDSVNSLKGVVNKRGRPYKREHARLMTLSRALRRAVEESGVTTIVTCHEARTGVADSLVHLYDVVLELLPRSQGSTCEVEVVKNRFGLRGTRALFLKEMVNGRLAFEDVTPARGAKKR